MRGIFLEVKQAIINRRAYRSLESVEITEELIYDLAECARLSASCFNNQPWRYVFVYNKEVLNEMHKALSQGNVWAKKASMIIVVFSKKEDDCVIYDREYYLFDTGMATAFIILRATELGLVAHPIAGYSPKKTREILGIPDEYNVITLVIVGAHSSKISPVLSDKQIKAEKKRPKRISLNQFVYINSYKEK
jgi:nitroreductase